MKVSYCNKNFKNGLKPVYKKLKKKFPDIKHKKKGCLGKCKTCKYELFVKIGKSKTITASSSKKLYKNVKKALTE